MPHLSTFLTPCRGGITIGKLDEVETIIDIRFQLVNRYISLRVLAVLELAHVEYGEGLSTNIL